MNRYTLKNQTEEIRGLLALLDKAREDHSRVLKDEEIQRLYDTGDILKARQLSGIRYPEHGKEQYTQCRIAGVLWGILPTTGRQGLTRYKWVTLSCMPTKWPRMEELARKIAQGVRA